MQQMMPIFKINLYIKNNIYINMGEPMGKKEIDALYRDAIFSHLIREGYTDYIAEVEARRRINKHSEM
jgi:hypothetical protein